MVVVNLTGGPKRVTFENADMQRGSFVDFENPEGKAKRVTFEPGERRDIRVAVDGKYVTLISPPCMRLIAVEEWHEDRR